MPALTWVRSIENLRSIAKARLPQLVFDFVDGGAEGEVTLLENCRSFNEVRFQPRNAVSFPQYDLRTTVLGTQISCPVILAPVGYSRLLHPQGEIAAARAAGDKNSIYVLSTLSGYSLEDIKAASRGPLWYQLYLIGGREVAERTIARARISGFSALVITIDTAVSGLRGRESQQGMGRLLHGNLSAKLAYLSQFLTHPAWVAGFLRDGGLPSLPNVAIPGKRKVKLSDLGYALARSPVTWKDLNWIRDSWRGPIVVKGVLTAEDAQRALDEGADAIVVSNHGGRQLDCVPATLEVLPEIVAAVKGRAEVLMDGGIRRGSDVVKAMCLGARAVLIGRAYAYGLAARGHAGVLRCLDILQDDISRTLALLGCPAVRDLNDSYVSMRYGSWRSSARVQYEETQPISLRDGDFQCEAAASAYGLRVES